jgi:DNA-binding NarL/FixJ family response regulator
VELADRARVEERVRLAGEMHDVDVRYGAESVRASVHNGPSPQRLVGAQDSRQRARERVGALTARELEVLAFLGAGRSNLQIARRLHLSEDTVKGYVSRLLVKLDCDTRTQAGLLAHEAGLGSADA